LKEARRLVEVVEANQLMDLVNACCLGQVLLVGPSRTQGSLIAEGMRTAGLLSEQPYND